MITIKWKDIRYDVEQQTWRLAKMRITDAELKDDAQADQDTSPNDVVLRFAEEGNAKVHALLLPRIIKYGSVLSDDSLDKSITAWEYMVDKCIDERSVAILIHKFVVSYILYKWSQIYFPDSTQAFATDMADAEQALNKETYNNSSAPKKMRPACK
jgi:hypothetical protein